MRPEIVQITARSSPSLGLDGNRAAAADDVEVHIDVARQGFVGAGEFHVAGHEMFLGSGLLLNNIVGAELIHLRTIARRRPPTEMFRRRSGGFQEL